MPCWTAPPGIRPTTTSCCWTTLPTWMPSWSRPHPEEPRFRLLARDGESFQCVVGKEFPVFPSPLKNRRSPQERPEELQGRAIINRVPQMSQYIPGKPVFPALPRLSSRGPRRFVSLVDKVGGSPAAMKQAGIAYATDQIIDLYANGVKNVHVYTMNKPDVARKILENLSEILG